MRATESIPFFSNAAAGTSAAFEVKGGIYQLALVATGAGTATVQTLGGDGTTWVPVQATTAALTAAGTQNYTVPPGQYRLVTTGFTGVTAVFARVPVE